MSSEEYTIMLEIVKRIEARFSQVSQKHADLKDKIEKSIDETKKKTEQKTQPCSII